MAVDRNHDGAYTDDDDIQFVTDTTASVAIDADTLPLRDWTGRLPAGPGVLVLGAVPAGGWTPDTEPTGVEFVRYRIDGGAVKLTRRALPMRTLIGRSPVTSDADLTAPDTGPLRARAWPSGTPVSFWNGWEPLVEQHFDGTTENFAIISTPPPGTSGPSVFRVDLLHEIDLALVEQYPGQRVHVVLWGADDANNVTGYPATGFPTVGPSSRVPLEAPLPGVVDMTDTRESYLLTRRVNRAPRSSF